MDVSENRRSSWRQEAWGRKEQMKKEKGTEVGGNKKGKEWMW
jgi:hypothetical protein